MARIEIYYTFPWCLVGTISVITYFIDAIEQPYFTIPINTCPFDILNAVLLQVPHTKNDTIYINGNIYQNPASSTSTIKSSAVPLVVVTLIGLGIVGLMIRKKGR